MTYLILYTRITTEPRFSFQKAYSVPILPCLLFQIIIASIDILTPTVSIGSTIPTILIYASLLFKSYRARYKQGLMQRISKSDQYKKIKILPTRITLTTPGQYSITLIPQATAKQTFTRIRYYSLASIRSSGLTFITIPVEITRRKRLRLTLQSFAQIYNQQARRNC